MRWSLAKPLAPFLWTLMPMYGIERLADAYYLARSPTFYLISGWRLEVFIIAALAGSIAAGAYLKDLRGAILTQSAAIATLFAGLYVICDPRVCYSTGPDGLEPLRFGLFLGAVAASGSSMGTGVRGISPGARGALAVTVAGFFAVAYYPVVFTFAGARLLPALDPLPVDLVLLVLSAATAMSAARWLGGRRGALVPVLGFLLVLGATFGVAQAYLASLEASVALMSGAVAAGAAMGAWVSGGPRLWSRSLGPPCFAVAVVLVLAMTVVVIPDAVSGVIPSTQSPGAPTVGTPVYSGAYQTGPQGHSDGAMVNVSFAGTDPGIIQPGNYLSAGMGIHSAGCCIDGIDYAYRFDVIMFHGGGEGLLATGWEACDDNAACGGHSWKILLFDHEAPLASPQDNFSLMMKWDGGVINWLYADGGGFVNFTSYSVPAPENHDFNTGVSGGAFSLSEEKGAYFYQFGIMSGYPIGQGGWRVTLSCPSLLVNSSWECVSHASTLAGADSYWKVIWRWGESYPGVSVSSTSARSLTFEYEPLAKAVSFQQLW